MRNRYTIFTAHDKTRACEQYWVRFLKRYRQPQSVLVVPPDITRLHSGAGRLVALLCQHWKSSRIAILPALGTHRAMHATQIRAMFGDSVPHASFLSHDWRKDTVVIGVISKQEIADITQRAVERDWHVAVNRRIMSNEYDLILSLGQVAPHEVVGMANHSKNIIIGLGGADSINSTHFLSAQIGIENILGTIDNPIRALINRAAERFLSKRNIVYVLSVMERHNIPHALLIGDDYACFRRAAQISRAINITTFDSPIQHAVVYLNPQQYQSLWVANKAIYRLRKALAAQGVLTIIAPGLCRYADNRIYARLIARYGYCGSKQLLIAMQKDHDLSRHSAVLAHLIHGSSEDKFRVQYAAPLMSPAAIRAVGYDYLDYDQTKIYAPFEKLNGWYRTTTHMEYYFVHNPGIGLWECTSSK